MKKNSLIVIAAIVVVVFSFLLIPACSFAGGVEPLKKAERPVWQVGDTWTYEVKLTDGSKNKKFSQKITVIRCDDAGYAVALEKENGEKRVEFYSKDINFVHSTDEKGGMVQSCKPEVPIFRWPLEPGRWWKESYFRQDNRESAFISLTTEVTGSELLVSADGKEVATMKIVSKRSRDETQTKHKINRNKFLGKRETWYDPLSRFVIKRVDYGSSGKMEEENLVSFTPGGGGTK